MKTTQKLGAFGRVHEVYDTLVGFPSAVVERTMCGKDYRPPENYLDAKRTPCPECIAALAAGAQVPP